MRRRHRTLPQVACCPHFKYLSLPVVVVVVVVVVIMHFAEFGSARLWCFLGEPKAVLNLLPILTRLPTKQDLLFLLMPFSCIWHLRLWWRGGAMSWRTNIFRAFVNNTIYQYGETDEGLRRGNPLSLCADRWAGRFCFVSLTNCSQVCKVASAVAEPRNCRESYSQHGSKPRCLYNALLLSWKLLSPSLTSQQVLNIVYVSLCTSIWKYSPQDSSPLTG